MKYKGIIVDDEPKILQLIQMLGHWQDYDMEIMHTCTNGREALEYILADKPDFVISDIKMPDLDGIQMLEKVREKNLDTYFILISGYRHFEYARSAVALNVVDYLLKPINEDQLNETLKKVCKMLEEKSMIRQEKEEYQLLKQQQKKTRQDLFWNTLIHPEKGNEYTDYFIDRDVLNQRYNFEFKEDSWQIVFLTTNIYQSVQFEDSLFEEELIYKFHSFFGKISTMYFLKNHFGYNIILNFNQKSTAKIRESIIALFYSIRDLQDIYGNFTLHIGVSEVHKNCRELKEAFLEARAAEWGRFTIHFDSVLLYSQISHLERIASLQLIANEQIQEICSALRYLKEDQLAKTFEKISGQFQDAENYSPDNVAEAYFALIDAATETINEESRETFSQGIDKAFLTSSNYKQLIQSTFQSMTNYVLSEQNKIKQKNKKPISDAMQYIDSHYTEPISQTDVADACGISTTYMSRLFKEEIGIGFQDYLTKIRIEKAEKMLIETNMSVKEIAVSVGYPDEKYFSKLYKKQTGIKPSEYRKIYG